MLPSVAGNMTATKRARAEEFREERPGTCFPVPLISSYNTARIRHVVIATVVVLVPFSLDSPLAAGALSHRFGRKSK